jgi:hypothetical protein
VAATPVQSSRRLERECGRNLELIWLTGRLAPNFKTIADFRRDNGRAIRKVCSRFVALCRDLHLLDGNAVAIDGSKFKAVNHREKNFTKDRLAKRIAAIESTIERYLKELDRADREREVTGVPVPAAKVARLAQGIETLKAKLGRLSAIEAQMLASGETQISLTDPDARAMTSQSHSAYTWTTLVPVPFCPMPRHPPGRHGLVWMDCGLAPGGCQDQSRNRPKPPGRDMDRSARATAQAMR